jgi:hypothetical protein
VYDRVFGVLHFNQTNPNKRSKPTKTKTTREYALTRTVLKTLFENCNWPILPFQEI